MAVSDPVADFLTRIRNALNAQHRYVDLSWSKMKQSISDILKDQGYIDNYLVKKETNSRGTIRIFLKYREGRKSVIKGIKRVSKPGMRKYIGHEDVPCFYGGLGLAIVSTSQGVLDGAEAIHRKVGGELICLVW